MQGGSIVSAHYLRPPNHSGTLLSVLFIALFSLAWAPVQTEPMRPARDRKVDRRLQNHLSDVDLKQANENQKTFNIWVFFTDKGILDEGSLRRALNERARTLDDHARARRLKVKTAGAAVDFADLALQEAYVHSVLETGAGLRIRSRWLNAVSVRATAEQIGRLAELSFVSSIGRVAGFRRRGFATTESGPPRRISPGTRTDNYGPSYTQLHQIAVPQYHQWLLQNGFDSPGAGVRIGLLDTGYELDHDVFQQLNVLDAWDFINGDSVVADESGDPEHQAAHGTAVLSIIAGYQPGQLIGPAYGAAYILGKTEVYDSETPIEEDYWVAGLEWAEGRGADVVSSSLGYVDWYDYEDLDGQTAVTTVAADLAALRGVVVVTAAGNEGLSGWQHMIAPSDGDLVIAVGAVDTLGVRAGWSSIGPTYDGRIKPDLMACGSGTYTAGPYTSSSYYRATGTSVATPLVAGVAALLLQADSTMTPPDVADALRNTAGNAAYPDNYYGWGIVNAEAARTGLLPQQPVPVDVYNYPNPFTEGTTIGFPVPGCRQVTVKVFTIAGEPVRELAASCPQGDHWEVYWDGRNDSGKVVSEGVYLYLVDNGREILRGKMVRLNNG